MAIFWWCFFDLKNIIWDRHSCIVWTIQDVRDVDAWSRYPMWALLNFRINPWSLNQDYPCRVKPQPPLLKSRFCVVPHGINHWSPFWVFFWLLFDISWCPLFAEVKREIKHWFSNLKVPTLDIEIKRTFNFRINATLHKSSDLSVGIKWIQFHEDKKALFFNQALQYFYLSHKFFND